MKKLSLAIPMILFAFSCTQKTKDNILKPNNETIVLKSVLIDTGWQETPNYTRFLLLFDYSQYKGKFNRVKIIDFKKISLYNDGYYCFDCFLKPIESDDINYKLNKKWKRSVPNFDFSSLNKDLVTELHSIDSVKFKIRLFFRKEEIKELIDSVHFTLNLYDDLKNDTIINFKFGVNQIKWGQTHIK